jgi:hypothetical protein
MTESILKYLTVPKEDQKKKDFEDKKKVYEARKEIEKKEIKGKSYD